MSQYSLSAKDVLKYGYIESSTSILTKASVNLLVYECTGRLQKYVPDQRRPRNFLPPRDGFISASNTHIFSCYLWCLETVGTIPITSAFVFEIDVPVSSRTLKVSFEKLNEPAFWGSWATTFRSEYGKWEPKRPLATGTHKMETE